MKGFRQGEDPIYMGLFLASAFLLSGIAIFLILVKAPSPSKVRAAKVYAQKRQYQQMLQAKAAEQQSEAKVKARLWPAKLDDMGPSALKSLTRIATEHSVRLTSFRPQRTTTIDGLIQAPYLVTAEGSFPNVVAFVRGVESSSLRLAVNQANVSATDQASDKATANIGVVGYVRSEHG